MIESWMILWILLGLLFSAGLAFLLWLPIRLHFKVKLTNDGFSGNWKLQVAWWEWPGPEQNPHGVDASGSSVIDDVEISESSSTATPTVAQPSVANQGDNHPHPPPTVPPSPPSANASEQSGFETKTNAQPLPKSTREPNVLLQKKQNTIFQKWFRACLKGFRFLAKKSVEMARKHGKAFKSWFLRVGVPRLKAFGWAWIKMPELWRKGLQWLVKVLWNSRRLIGLKWTVLRVIWGEKHPGQLAEWQPIFWSAFAVIPPNSGLNWEWDWRPARRRNVDVEGFVQHRLCWLIGWLIYSTLQFPWWTMIRTSTKAWLLTRSQSELKK